MKHIENAIYDAIDQVRFERNEHKGTSKEEINKIKMLLRIELQLRKAIEELEPF